jgi:crotonobetainyl-CoA:carnitine CoA-transferase CaiB-like acyl-CoA transferase
MTEQALSDVKVLDLSWYIAGPYCGKLLADYGADVIKIEKPDEGDPARRMGPFQNDESHPEKSGLFLHLNTNKRGMILDLKSEAGKTAFIELIREADILVESFSPGVMERLGLGFDELIKINPALVMTSISNFGQTGPYRNYQANDIITYAMGGAMSSTGLPDREPVNVARNIKLFECGWLAAVATLGVWMGAAKDGIGDHIDFSLMEAQAGSTDRRSTQLLGYSYCGDNTLREDLSKDRGTCLPNTYMPVKDGWILPVITAPRWKAFTQALGRPELLEDERFQDILDVTYAYEMDGIFLEWIGDKGKEQVSREMQAMGLPVTPINTPEDAMKSDHFRQRGFWIEIDHPEAGIITYPGAPVDMAEGGFALRRPAPLLGQHNGERFAEQPGKPEEALKGKKRDKTSLPLEGVRVVAMTVVWAGPFAALLLADLGAEVIRLETIHHHASITRGLFSVRPPQEYVSENEAGGWWQYPDKQVGDFPYNRCTLFNANGRNKLGMTLDLERPRGIEVFKDLMKTTDVFIENNSPEVLDKLGISYEMMREANPGIIVVRGPGYGLTGPYSSWKGYGINLEGVLGHTWLSQYSSDEIATISHTLIADATGGCGMALAVLMALHHRNKTGHGQLIDLAQGQTLIPCLGEAYMDYAMNGRVQRAVGNRHPAAVQGCYPCKGDDNWVVISINNDRQWEGFRRALGNPDWTADDRFSDAPGRRTHHDDIDAFIAEWTQSQDKYDIMECLQQEGVPAGPVLSEADAFQDSHLRDREFFREITQKWCGTHDYPGFPWKTRNTPQEVRLPPPGLGEHNEYVFKELLGLSDKEYAELEKDNYIGTEYLPDVL